MAPIVAPARLPSSLPRSVALGLLAGALAAALSSSAPPPAPSRAPSRTAGLDPSTIELPGYPMRSFELQWPTPARSSVDALLVQLYALAQNDLPHESAGIIQAWLFASPENRAHTGPLDRFGAMVTSTTYAPLLGHNSFRLVALSETSERAEYLVRVFDRRGQTHDFQWVLGRRGYGPYAGSWLTDSVMPREPYHFDVAWSLQLNGG